MTPEQQQKREAKFAEWRAEMDRIDSEHRERMRRIDCAERVVKWCLAFAVGFCLVAVLIRGLVK